MGKIVAIGGCSEDDEESIPLFEKIMELSPKKTWKVTYLPTAQFDRDDGFPAIEERFKSLGCKEVVSLHLSDEKLTKKEIEDTILSSDIVYESGGNLKFLMDTWTKADALDVMKKAFENNIVLCGTSSGSMCWFDRGYDDCGENGEFMFVDCLGFIPYCNCPHFQSEYWKSFIAAAPSQDLPGLAIDNDAALVYDDGKMYVTRIYDDCSAYLITKENNYTVEEFKQ